jgi:hypothetical protein
MAGTDWPFTGLGRTFFDGTLPQLVKNIGRLADELKRYNDKADIENAEVWPPADAEKCDECGAAIYYAEKDGYYHYDPGHNTCKVEFIRPRDKKT